MGLTPEYLEAQRKVNEWWRQMADLHRLAPRTVGFVKPDRGDRITYSEVQDPRHWNVSPVWEEATEITPEGWALQSSAGIEKPTTPTSGNT